MYAYNIVVLLLATGLSTGFYYATQSPHSFWWMALLLWLYSSEKAS